MLAFLKRLLVGDVVHIAEVKNGWGYSVLRLKLKRDPRTGRPYAVLRLGGRMRASYREMTPNDVRLWAEAFRTTEAVMQAEFGPWLE